MTRPSRGISDIQEKARGRTNMAKLKAGMAPLKKKDVIKAKVTKRAPTPDLAQLGAMRGMYKGGAIDGIAKKGKTRGKVI